MDFHECKISPKGRRQASKQKGRNFFSVLQDTADRQENIFNILKQNAMGIFFIASVGCILLLALGFFYLSWL